MLEFRTLGPLSLRADARGELHTVLAQPKRIALLAYLAASPLRPHRRDTLTALFWPELDEDHARGALRQLLRGLRQVLDPETIVSVGDDVLALDSTRCWCDSPAFDEAATAGRSHEALALYHGDYLEGFFLSDAPEFERWLDEERTRLRRLAAGAALARAGECRSAGRLPDAVTCARRATSLAPDDEEALRHLIRLLDELGDRAGALRVYEAFERRLATEFSCQPAPETHALVDAVRSRDLSRPDAGGAAGPSASLPGSDSGAARTPAPLADAAGASHVSPARAPRPATRRVLAVGLAAVLAVAMGVTLRWPHRPALSPRRVVVVGFANRTGDPTLDRLGDMTADWITRGLSQTGLVEVADAREDGAAPRTAADVRTLADESGAGFVVTGAFYLVRDSVRLEATIVDARRRRVLRGIEPVVGSRGAVTLAVESLRQHVVAALATVIDSSLASWATVASQPPSFEAYEEFLAGMQAWNGVHGAEALPHFSRAAALDASYTLPLVMMAAVHASQDECAATDSLGAVLDARGAVLPPVERDQLDVALNRCRGSAASTYQAARRLADALPGSDYALGTLGHFAVLANRPREALAALESIDPEHGASRGWMPYYLWLTSALHALGDHRRELDEARRGRRQYPGQLGMLRAEAIALAALGRVREVNAVLDVALSADTNRFRRADLVMQEVSLELRAHGHAADGRAVAARALDWYEARTAIEAGSPTMRFEHARMLDLAGRAAAARRLVQPLADAYPDSERFAGFAGMLAARDGDSLQAQAMDARLRALHRPYLRGATAYWRACIAAARGRRDEAVALLSGALADGLVYSASAAQHAALHADYCFESLRTYAPFQALLRPQG